MRRYFESVAPADAAWAVYFSVAANPSWFWGAKTGRPCPELCWTADGLFYESYDAVGDVAETIALLLPEAQQSSELPLSTWVEERLLVLRSADEATKREALRLAWDELDFRQRFIWNKLITGEFRVGVPAARGWCTCTGDRNCGRRTCASPDGRMATFRTILSMADCRRDQ